MVTRRITSLFVCFAACAACLFSFAPPAGAQGLVESATASTSRARWSTRDVPANRGRFTFPSPYNTEAARLTQSSDCGGADCVFPVGYSYWNNINNHVGSDEMLIFLSLQSNKGGVGPSLLSYNKKTGEVQNRGSLFAGDNTYGWAKLATAETWYFSATMPHALYINEPMGTRLFRYDVVTHNWETVFDAGSRFSGKYIWQAHSSNDDKVHSATIRDKASYRMEGCMVSRNGRIDYFAAVRNDFDECQIDKSGRWLLIKEDLDGNGTEDNRVIDLENNNAERRLMDPDGAAGHSDLGYGYLVAEDNFNPQPSAVRVWDFTQELRGGEPTSPVAGQGTLVYQHTEWNDGLGHIAHSNSKQGVPISQQMACASHAARNNLPRVNEIVCFRLDGSMQALVVAPNLVDLNASGGDFGGDGDYWRQPKGNLDVTGEYFIWTANVGSNRLDAFVVKVPQDKLGVTSGGSNTPSSSSSSSPSSPSSPSAPASPSEWPTGCPTLRPLARNSANAIPASAIKYVETTCSSSSPAPSGGSTSTPAPAPTPAPTTSAASAAPVVWTSVVNASATGSTLVKNGGCDGCPDAGGVSAQQIKSGDGYVEFSVPEAGTLRFVGLSTENSVTDPMSIKFALRLQNGVAEVRESGGYKSETSFGAGDTLRVAVAGSTVQYSKNGSVFYTSSTRPAYPLMAGASLFNTNSTVFNAVIAGGN